MWGLTNADVHEHRKKAKLIRGLPLPRIDDCYAGGSAAAEARHDEVRAELTADQWREAINLVTLAAEAKRKVEHDLARSRLTATVDSWFRDVPALTQELIENKLKAAVAELTPEDFFVAWELCEEHAVRLRSQ